MEIKESETEVKEIEEFLKTAETQKGKKQKKGRGEFAGKIKQFLPAVVVILLAIILFAALMSQGAKVSSLENEVTALKSKINANEITELKSHVAALETKVDKLAREKDQMREEITGLNQKLEAIKAQRAKAAETKKPGADKKKAAPKSGRPSR